MRKSIKLLWITVLGVLGLFILMILLIYFGIVGNSVSIASLENPGFVLPSAIISDSGAILGKYVQADRSFCTSEEISRYACYGLIATEDVAFYDHNGLKVNGFMDVPYYFIRGRWFHRPPSITQQLAHRLLINNSEGDFSAGGLEGTFQKIQELLLTVKLERHFTKQEILTLYLNTACFGDSIYGIGNAARSFFNKDAGSLTVEEAATLIGVQKVTRLYNPRWHPDIALSRRNLVIELMAKYDFIAASAAKEAISKPIILQNSCIEADSYYSDTLREEMESWCKQHKKADGTGYNLYQDGLKIYTVRSIGGKGKSICISSINDRYGHVLEVFHPLPSKICGISRNALRGEM